MCELCKNKKGLGEICLDCHRKKISEYKQQINKTIDKHTIKNADGEYYIACSPEVLKKDLGVE